MRPVDNTLKTEKRCTGCCLVKPVDQFRKRSDPRQPINGWSYTPRCLECSRADARAYGTEDRKRRNARLKAWLKANPEKARERDRRRSLLYRYGITATQADAIFAPQGGLCAICGVEARLCIDHDHATGAIRGGLCIGCNARLHHVDVDPAWARKHHLGAAMLAYIAAPPAAALLLKVGGKVGGIP